MIVVVVGACLLGAADAAAADREADRQLELKARAAFAAGRYDQALDMLAKLYADTLHPIYLRNIGRCHQKMREPDKAIDAFQDYLAKSKKVSAAERREIEGYIREMEALRDEKLSAQRVAATSAAAAAPVAALAPAPALARSQEPSPPETTTIATQPAPPRTTEISLIAPSPAPVAGAPPFYSRWWFWTAVGVVVAGGVTTAVLLSRPSRPPCPVVCQ